MTLTIKRDGATVAAAAPPDCRVLDDGTIELKAGPFTVLLGKDIKPLRLATVRFCAESERACRLARLAPAPEGS